MNPSKRKIDQEIQEKEFARIIRLLKKLSPMDIETLKSLIENQIIFQETRIAKEYFQGQVDLWDKIFQALQ